MAQLAWLMGSTAQALAKGYVEVMPAPKVTPERSRGPRSRGSPSGCTPRGCPRHAAGRRPVPAAEEVSRHGAGHVQRLGGPRGGHLPADLVLRRRAHPPQRPEEPVHDPALEGGRRRDGLRLAVPQRRRGVQPPGARRPRGPRRAGRRRRTRGPSSAGSARSSTSTASTSTPWPRSPPRSSRRSSGPWRSTWASWPTSSPTPAPAASRPGRSSTSSSATAGAGST